MVERSRSMDMITTEGVMYSDFEDGSLDMNLSTNIRNNENRCEATKSYMYNCHICEFKTNVIEIFANHMTISHQLANKLNQERRVVDAPKQKQHLCRLCGYYTIYSSTFKRHNCLKYSGGIPLPNFVKRVVKNQVACNPVRKFNLVKETRHVKEFHPMNDEFYPVKKLHHIKEFHPEKKLHHIKEFHPEKKLHHIKEFHPEKKLHHIKEFHPVKKFHHVQEFHPEKKLHHIKEFHPVKKRHPVNEFDHENEFNPMKEFPVKNLHPVKKLLHVKNFHPVKKLHHVKEFHRVKKLHPMNAFDPMNEFDPVKEFDHVQKPLNRVKKVPVNPSLVCTICRFKAKSKGALRLHNIIHERNALRCPECNFISHFQELMDVHKMSHKMLNLSQEKPIKCPQCSYSTFRMCSLERHLRRHSKKLKCDKCPYVGSDKEDLKTHLTAHSQNYNCALCQLTLKSTTEFEEHLGAHTQLNDDQLAYLDQRKYRCSQCYFGTDRKGSLNNHMVKHSPKVKVVVTPIVDPLSKETSKPQSPKEPLTGDNKLCDPSTSLQEAANEPASLTLDMKQNIEADTTEIIQTHTEPIIETDTKQILQTDTKPSPSASQSENNTMIGIPPVQKCKRKRKARRKALSMEVKKELYWCYVFARRVNTGNSLKATKKLCRNKLLERGIIKEEEINSLSDTTICQIARNVKKLQYSDITKDELKRIDKDVNACIRATRYEKEVKKKA